MQNYQEFKTEKDLDALIDEIYEQLNNELYEGKDGFWSKFWSGLKKAATLNGWVTQQLKNIFGIKTKILDKLANEYDKVLEEVDYEKLDSIKNYKSDILALEQAFKAFAETNNLDPTPVQTVLSSIYQLKQVFSELEKTTAATAKSKLFSIYNQIQSSLGVTGRQIINQFESTTEFKELAKSLYSKYGEYLQGTRFLELFLFTPDTSKIIDYYKINAIFNRAEEVYTEPDPNDPNYREHENKRLKRYWERKVLKIQTKYSEYFSQEDMMPIKMGNIPQKGKDKIKNYEKQFDTPNLPKNIAATTSQIDELSVNFKKSYNDLSDLVNDTDKHKKSWLYLVVLFNSSDTDEPTTYFYGELTETLRGEITSGSHFDIDSTREFDMSIFQVSNKIFFLKDEHDSSKLKSIQNEIGDVNPKWNGQIIPKDYLFLGISTTVREEYYIKGRQKDTAINVVPTNKIKVYAFEKKSNKTLKQILDISNYKNSNSLKSAAQKIIKIK